MTRSAIILLLAGWLALLAPHAAAYQRAAVANAPDRYLYWQIRTLHFSINNQGSRDLPIHETVGAVKRSFFTWASPSCTDIFFDYDGLDPAVKTNLTMGQSEGPDNKNLLVWHESWPPAGVTDGSVTSEMPAVTTIIYSTENGIIVDADIDFNNHDFYWTTTNDTTKVETDIENILTHEIGHLLGLDHSQDKEATMYDSTHKGELSKRSLHADDVLGLCVIYPYAKTTPPGQGQGEVPKKVQGGCQVAPLSGSSWGGGLLLLLCAVMLALRADRRRRP
jgi:hypothetical protein